MHKIIAHHLGSVGLICPTLGHTTGTYTSIGVICSCGLHIVDSPRCR